MMQAVADLNAFLAALMVDEDVLPEQVVLFHDHIRGPEYYEKGES